MKAPFLLQVAQTPRKARATSPFRTTRSEVAGCEQGDRTSREPGDRRRRAGRKLGAETGRLMLSVSALAIACATGVDPEGASKGPLDGGAGVAGFGGSAGSTGSGGSSGTFGANGASGSGGSGAFSGGSAGTGGASGSSGASGLGGTLGASGTSGSTGFGGTAGTAGAAGSGGSVGSGGSGGTAPVKPCAAAAPDAGTGVVKVQMHNREDTGPTDNEIQPILNLVNLTGAAIPLTELTVRYWYTKEPSDADQNLNCDHAAIGASNIDTGNDVFTALDAAVTGANWYFEVRFTGGTLPANGQTGEIKLRMHTQGFQNFSEVDDHSYCQASTFTDWDRVTAYRDGNLVWGIEP
jgi:hypothetical protein